MQVPHGADLARAMSQYGGRAQDWWDLSAAISPYSWWAERGLPTTSEAAHYLPQDNATLEQSTLRYYGERALPVPGSQRAIQLLPQCFSMASVWVLANTYAEHELAWRNAGHCVRLVDTEEIRQAFSTGRALPNILVLVNPANPSGERFDRAELQQWAQQLQQTKGWLLVDEAFMDCTPEHSLLHIKRPDNAIVLRSLGKFFGLAGWRVGFVLASEELLNSLSSRLGPWPVAGPALEMAYQALCDEAWQQQQLTRLQRVEEQVLMLSQSLPVVGHSSLFITIKVKDALVVQQRLAAQRIWVRAFVAQNWIRLSMPRADQLSDYWALLKQFDGFSRDSGSGKSDELSEGDI